VTGTHLHTAYKQHTSTKSSTKVRLKPDGIRRGEVKGKLANGVGGQYSHTTSERCVSSITNADAHTLPASIRLNSQII
jgi:hypothetical protein